WNPEQRLPRARTLGARAPTCGSPVGPRPQGIQKIMQSTLDAILTQLPDYAIKVVGVLALFIAGRWLANRLAKNLRRNLERKELDPTLAGFFSTMTRILVLVVVVLACLSIFGIETTSVAAVLGAAAFAVGLALQGSLANFAAGVMLVVFRPYRVDDVVTVAS